jgi:hypothetical protein
VLVLVPLVVLAGLLLGKLAGGRISRIGSARIRFWPLVFLALAIQLLIFLPFFQWPQTVVAILYSLSMGLLFVFGLLSIRLPGMVIIILGLLLNLLAISFNGGFMPADAEAYASVGKGSTAKALQENQVVNNLRLMTDQTKLNGLGDRIPLPFPMGLGSVISAGDIVLLVGLLVLIIFLQLG